MAQVSRVLDWLNWDIKCRPLTYRSRIIQELKTKAEANGLAITAKRADFRDLKGWQSARFDAVVCSGEFSDTSSQDRRYPGGRLAVCCGLSGAAGGVVVVGMHNYLRLKQEGENLLVRHGWQRPMQGRSFSICDLLAQTESNHLHVDPSRGQKWQLRTYTKSYLCLSADELRDAMLQVGFDWCSSWTSQARGNSEMTNGRWQLA